ncbi:MAG: CHASE2 domain-containing protein, partial [Thermoanaerobaculia bacterium]
MKYIFAVFAIILCNFLFLFSPFLNIDNFIYDILMILSFPYDSKYEIAVVEIDEESLKFLGRWPWKRELIAQLITNILKEEPKILCIDIGFFEKSENDKFLIDALKSEIPIVLPIFLAKEEPLTIKFPPKELLHPNVYLGHLHILIDSDGEVRRIPSRIKFKGMEYPSFSVQAARVLNFNKKIPAEINIFYQTPEPFLFYSALKVLEGNNLNLKEKIVFLGGTSEGLWDSFLTPISSSSHLTPGVLIQAHAFRTVVSNKSIKTLNQFGKVILSFLLILFFIILKR